MAFKVACQSCGDWFDNSRGLSNHQRQCKGAKHLKLELSRSRTSAAQALKKAHKQKKLKNRTEKVKDQQHPVDANMVNIFIILTVSDVQIFAQVEHDVPMEAIQVSCVSSIAFPHTYILVG